MDVTSTIDWSTLSPKGTVPTYVRGDPPPKKDVVSKFATDGGFVLRRVGQRTQSAMADEPLDEAVSFANDQDVLAPEVEKARDDRVSLLAIKYEGTRFNAEHDARLKILTQRLRKLNPRITEHDWAVVFQMAEDVAASSGRLDQMAAELGLD